MSGNKHDGNAKQHNNKGIAKQSGSKGNSEKAKEEQVESDTEGEDQNRAKCHPHEVVVNIPPQQNRWTIGNWIALGAGIATVSYFVATVLILHATNKAADISDSTFQEVKTEFELANRPYVFYKTINITELIPNADVRGSVDVKNYGKTPALILYEAFTPIFSNLQVLPFFNYKIEDYKPLNMYIADSINVSIPFKFPVSEAQYRDILINKLFLYIHGKIIYRSVINDKLYEYDYCYSILNNKRFRPTSNHNLVKEIKSDSIPEELKKSGYFAN